MPQADHAASRRRVPGRDSRVHGFCRRISYIYHAKPLKSPAMKTRKLLLYLGIVLSGLLTASCAVRPPRPAPVAPPAHHRPGPPRDRERPRPPKRHDKPPRHGHGPEVPPPHSGGELLPPPPPPGACPSSGGTDGKPSSRGWTAKRSSPACRTCGAVCVSGLASAAVIRNRRSA